MNEVLVRGKDAIAGKWVVGVFVPYKWDNLKHRIDAPYIICMDSHKWKDGKTIRVILETIGLFTGFYDKNNKMVFRGDILENPWIGYRFTVEWDSSCGMWIMQHVNSDYKMNFTAYNKVDFEVIGNIYDNPEMMTEVQSEITCGKAEECIYKERCPYDHDPMVAYLCFESKYIFTVFNKKQGDELIKE